VKRLIKEIRLFLFVKFINWAFEVAPNNSKEKVALAVFIQKIYERQIS